MQQGCRGPRVEGQARFRALDSAPAECQAAGRCAAVGTAPPAPPLLPYCVAVCQLRKRKSCWTPRPIERPRSQNSTGFPRSPTPDGGFRGSGGYPLQISRETSGRLEGDYQGDEQRKDLTRSGKKGYGSLRLSEGLWGAAVISEAVARRQGDCKRPRKRAVALAPVPGVSKPEAEGSGLVSGFCLGEGRARPRLRPIGLSRRLCAAVRRRRSRAVAGAPYGYEITSLLLLERARLVRVCRALVPGCNPRRWRYSISQNKRDTGSLRAAATSNSVST